MNCPTCGQTVNPGVKLAQRMRDVNHMLWECGKTYYESLGEAMYAVTASLSVNDFETQPFTDSCLLNQGKDKHQHAPVGERKYVSASYHRMPSGRWELVAYVS